MTTQVRMCHVVFSAFFRLVFSLFALALHLGRILQVFVVFSMTGFIVVFACSIYCVFSMFSHNIFDCLQLRSAAEKGRRRAAGQGEAGRKEAQGLPHQGQECSCNGASVFFSAFDRFLLCFQHVFSSEFDLFSSLLASVCTRSFSAFFITFSLFSACFLCFHHVFSSVFDLFPFAFHSFSSLLSSV